MRRIGVKIYDTAAIFWVLVALIATASLIPDVRVRTASAASTASSSLTIGEQLRQKTLELNAINAALDVAKKSLNDTRAQRVTLQNQLQIINGNINALNLGIQADKVSSDQLALEVQQLTSDLGDITQSVEVRRAAVGALLQEMQKNDTMNGNMLALFLNGGTLADNVLEANSIVELQTKLANDVTALQDLHIQYEQEIADSNAKQSQIVLAEADLQNKKSIVQDQQQQKQTLLNVTKGQESIYQQQYAALLKQQDQINAEIEAIDSILRTKIDPSAIPAFGAGVLLMPVAGGTQADITQGYGATAFARTRYVRQWHNGIDLAASIGTPILAAADGTVAATGNQDAYCPRAAYGKFVVVNHGDGLTTLYSHLSKILVSGGQAVKKGQPIAYSGNTGDVTGPHLHFTVYAQTTFYMQSSKSCGPMPYGGDLNPSLYLF